MFKYNVASPDISKLEKKYVNDALNKNEISSKGEYVGKFEELFAKKHGAKYGVSCNSGTASLTLALAALRIGPGDEVIVPDFTFASSAWSVSYLGAKPVFVDCDETFCIDVSKIEEKITPRTKAIMPVHIYGRNANMKRIHEIARDYNLLVIEDSCEAHSTPIDSDIACFSLYANKVITSGEGGIAITNNEKLAWQMKHLRDSTFSNDHSFYHPKMGYSFGMTNLQGAVAYAQTQRLDELIAKRKLIEKWYNNGLKDIDEVTVLPNRRILWMYDLLCYNREGLLKYLLKEGIETRRFFKPLTSQPMYRETPQTNEYSAYIAEVGLYLPTYSQLTKKDVEFITNKVKSFYEK